MLASLAEKLSSALPGDSHALDSIHHQLRSLGQQYSSSTTPVQRIITVQRGVALDLDSLSRDCKAHSKELYTFGQAEAEDIKDVTDRLAYMSFVTGSLSSALAEKFNAARAPLKSLRAAEAAIQPRRNARGALQLQISRIEQDQPRGMEKRLAELKQKLKEANLEDQPQEAEIALLKRQAIRESEQIKWEAIREYGEKLVLLSQAATPVIEALPKFPPTESSPYAGGLATGAARAALQRALDNYKTGQIELPISTSNVDLSRSDTRSFGVSHARELSSINTDSPHPGLPSASPPKPHSPPIDPATLNLAPAPIPHLSPPPVTAPILPTVAETGVPLSAGPAGPGPASGSLHDIRGASDSAGPRSKGLPGNNSTPAYGASFESAGEEKRRLQGYSEAAQRPGYETAEEEKKRLEREERERVFGATPGPSGSGKGPEDYDDAPPPSYQD
ncbi:Eisosome component PIL1-domain-containing protein [Mycena amicta]|nr:Eisosome component PIL1-domain-containing protein [Mycena amicta]